MSRRIQLSGIAVALPFLTAGASMCRANVELSGELCGYYNYIGQNVITTGPITLTGHTTIQVAGGGLTINHPITCGEDRDGDDGTDGSHDPIAAPTAGEAGLNGFNLTLKSKKISIPGHDPTGGPIYINAGIDLSGGDGGVGGDGADSGDRCSGECAQPGANGGPGGNGGNLFVSCCADIVINDAHLLADGGSGGAGGGGGRLTSDMVGWEHEEAGAGAQGANGGNGIGITIEHGTDAFDESVIYVVGYSHLSAQGGAGGAGGSGGSGLLGDGDSGQGGDGGTPGAGANGGCIQINGRTVILGSASVLIRTDGGDGGDGGFGGASGCGTFNWGCTGGYNLIVTGPGGRGGPAGPAGNGANVLIESTSNDSQTSIDVDGVLSANGGNGGNSGSCGHSGGDHHSGPCTLYEGRSAWPAKAGGAAGLVQIGAYGGTDVSFQCEVQTEGGDGGNGGNAGDGGGCWAYANVAGGTGGNGGPGAPGANVEVSGQSVTVTGAVLHLDGGDGGNGGNGGDCGGHGGAAAFCGRDGVFYVWGLKVGDETVVNNPQENGRTGLSGNPCD